MRAERKKERKKGGVSQSTIKRLVSCVLSCQLVISLGALDWTAVSMLGRDSQQNGGHSLLTLRTCCLLFLSRKTNKRTRKQTLPLSVYC